MEQIDSGMQAKDSRTAQNTSDWQRQDYDEQQSKVNHNSPFVQRAQAAANLPQR